MDCRSSIREVDREIIRLLEARCRLVRDLPDEPAPNPVGYPAAFAVDQVVCDYSGHLGGPGELLARAVLNVCRSALLR